VCCCLFTYACQVWSPPNRAVYIEFKDEESAKQARNFRWSAGKNLIVRAAMPRQARTSSGKNKRRRGPGPKTIDNTEDTKVQAEDAVLSPKLDSQKEGEPEEGGKESEKENEDESSEEDVENGDETEDEEDPKKAKSETWRFELTQLHTLCEYLNTQGSPFPTLFH
jgi:hypothetical protein